MKENNNSRHNRINMTSVDSHLRVIFTTRMKNYIEYIYKHNNEDKLSLARCSVTKGCVRWQDNTPGKLMVSENRNNRYIYGDSS